jgi:hypothetical protein
MSKVIDEGMAAGSAMIVTEVSIVSTNPPSSLMPIGVPTYSMPTSASISTSSETMMKSRWVMSPRTGSR